MGKQTGTLDAAAVPAKELANRLVRAAEIEAERTISWLRIVVALALGLVLVASLATVSEIPDPTVRRQIGVAMAVLLVYLGVGIAALCLATPKRFKAHHPWLFTAADCGLVLFNLSFTASNLTVSAIAIWVYPAVWLVPLVLVFGTLRYQVALQAVAVLVLTLGIVWLLAAAEPVGPELDAIEGLLEVPPTAIRVAMLGLAGLVLVLAAHRRRSLLDRSIKEASERANLARYLPPEIAAMLASGDVERLRRGWELDAGIVMLDIRGFTALAERLPPASISSLLAGFREQVIEIAAAHGGIVDKFVGDNAMIVFGVDDAALEANRPGGEDGQDRANRTIACAVALHERLTGWRADLADATPLRIGIGAHYGRVFAGAVGTAERLEFTVLGDAVNVAARLEQLTVESGGGLIASRDLVSAAELVDGALEARGWRVRPPTAIRGRRELLQILELVDLL